VQSTAVSLMGNTLELRMSSSSRIALPFWITKNNVSYIYLKGSGLTTSRSKLDTFSRDYPRRMEALPESFLPKFVSQLRRSLLHDLRVAGILMDMCRLTWMKSIDTESINNHTLRFYGSALHAFLDTECKLDNIKGRQDLINAIYRLELDVFAPSAEQVENSTKSKAKARKRFRREAPEGIEQNWWTERFNKLRKVEAKVEKINEKRKAEQGGRKGEREGHRRLLL
jgi:hypothetical protein